MPCSHRDYLRMFTRLEKGSMLVVEYETYFYTFPRHATLIFSSKCGRVFFIICELKLPLHMSTQSLVAAGRYFAKFSYHTQVIEEMHHKNHRGSDKRPRYQGSLVGDVVALDLNMEVLRVDTFRVTPSRPI